MTKQTVFIAVIVLFVMLAGACVFGYGAYKLGARHVKQNMASAEPIISRENLDTLTNQRAWFRWFFSEYAATLRYLQYGEATADINHLLAAHEDEFLKIQDLTSHLVCPAPSNGAFSDEYIYFGARGLPLVRPDGVDFYMLSYTGSATFIYGDKTFDAMFSS